MRRPGLLAVLAALALALAGATGVRLRSPADPHGAAPAAVGQPVAVGGARLTVVGAREVGDPMAAMHATNRAGFAASGMSMSSMSPDPVPAGRRRVRVDLVVHAGTEPIRYPVVAFGLHGPDGEHVTPRHSFLGDAELAPGMAATGSLEFDVPDRWAAPVLMLDGAAAGVTLEGLGPAPADPHTHH